MNLIFDLDDTLYDMMQPFQRACHAVWGHPLPVDPWTLFIRSRRVSDALYPLIAEGMMRSAGSASCRPLLPAASRCPKPMPRVSSNVTVPASMMLRSVLACVISSIGLSIAK